MPGQAGLRQTCPECNKVFGNLGGLNSHGRFKHGWGTSGDSNPKVKAATVGQKSRDRKRAKRKKNASDEEVELDGSTAKGSPDINHNYLQHYEMNPSQAPQQYFPDYLSENQRGSYHGGAPPGPDHGLHPGMPQPNPSFWPQAQSQPSMAFPPHVEQSPSGTAGGGLPMDNQKMNNLTPPTWQPRTPRGFKQQGRMPGTPQQDYPQNSPQQGWPQAQYGSPQHVQQGAQFALPPGGLPGVTPNNKQQMVPGPPPYGMQHDGMMRGLPQNRQQYTPGNQQLDGMQHGGQYMQQGGQYGMQHGAQQSMQHGGQQSMQHGAQQSMQHGGQQSMQHGGQQSMQHGGQQGLQHGGQKSLQHGQQSMQHGEQQSMQHGGQQGMQHGGQQNMQHGGQLGMQHGPQHGMQHGAQHGMQHGGQHGMQHGGQFGMQPGAPHGMQLGGQHGMPHGIMQQGGDHAMQVGQVGMPKGQHHDGAQHDVHQNLFAEQYGVVQDSGPVNVGKQPGVSGQLGMPESASQNAMQPQSQPGVTQEYAGDPWPWNQSSRVPSVPGDVAPRPPGNGEVNLASVKQERLADTPPVVQHEPSLHPVGPFPPTTSEMESVQSVVKNPPSVVNNPPTTIQQLNAPHHEAAVKDKLDDSPDGAKPGSPAGGAACDADSQLPQVETETPNTDAKPVLPLDASSNLPSQDAESDLPMDINLPQKESPVTSTPLDDAKSDLPSESDAKCTPSPDAKSKALADVKSDLPQDKLPEESPSSPTQDSASTQPDEPKTKTVHNDAKPDASSPSEQKLSASNQSEDTSLNNSEESETDAAPDTSMSSSEAQAATLDSSGINEADETADPQKTDSTPKEDTEDVAALAAAAAAADEGDAQPKGTKDIPGSPPSAEQPDKESQDAASTHLNPQGTKSKSKRTNSSMDNSGPPPKRRRGKGGRPQKKRDKASGGLGTKANEDDPKSAELDPEAASDELLQQAAGLFICPICHRQSPDLQALQNHTLFYHGHQGGKIYPCPDCGKTFRRLDSLRNHRNRMHLNKKYECPICKKLISDPSNLRSHVKYTHSSVKPFICEYCGDAFKSPHFLTQHVRQNHMEDGISDPDHIPDKRKRRSGGTAKQFCSCEHCGRQFKFPAALSRHIRNDHQCQECGETFLQKTDLMMHETDTHPTSKTHECELCGKVVGSLSQLAFHNYTHKCSSGVQCTDCNAYFKPDGELQRHREKHCLKYEEAEGCCHDDSPGSSTVSGCDGGLDSMEERTLESPDDRSRSTMFSDDENKSMSMSCTRSTPDGSISSPARGISPRPLVVIKSESLSMPATAIDLQENLVPSQPTLEHVNFKREETFNPREPLKETQQVSSLDVLSEFGGPGFEEVYAQTLAMGLQSGLDDEAKKADRDVNNPDLVPPTYEQPHEQKFLPPPYPGHFHQPSEQFASSPYNYRFAGPCNPTHDTGWGAMAPAQFNTFAPPGSVAAQGFPYGMMGYRGNEDVPRQAPLISLSSMLSPLTRTPPGDSQGNQSHECLMCDAAFGEHARLQQHELMHVHDRTLMCKHCGCRCDTINRLVEHARVQHGIWQI